MTIQVAFFEDDMISSLEKQVNNFLKTLQWGSTVDVKYHHSNTHIAESSESYERWESVYTAMVVYEPHGDSVPEGTEGGGAVETARRKGVIIQDNQGAEPV
jgi:hypothetical protein